MALRLATYVLRSHYRRLGLLLGTDLAATRGRIAIQLERLTPFCAGDDETNRRARKGRQNTTQSVKRGRAKGVGSNDDHDCIHEAGQRDRVTDGQEWRNVDEDDVRALSEAFDDDRSGVRG